MNKYNECVRIEVKRRTDHPILFPRALSRPNCMTDRQSTTTYEYNTLLRNERWLYNGVAIEVVDNFNYLGTVISFNSKFLANQEYIVGKSLKALNTLLANRSRIKLKPKILCELFDSCVGSIFWGLGCVQLGWHWTHTFKVLQTDFERSFQHMYFWCIRGARSLPFIHHTLH